MEIKVSIVIPVYKVEKYIERCLRSVFNQTYANIECIIVNDCTPDNSFIIAKEFVESYQGSIDFKFVEHEKNKGLSEARNTGIKMATGYYYFFLDSDDAIPPTSIGKLVETAVNSSLPEIVMGVTKGVDAKGALIEVSKVQQQSFHDNTSVFKGYVENQWYIIACNKLIRRDIFEEHHTYFMPGITHEDVLWSFEISTYIKSIILCNNVTYYYYIADSNSISRSPWNAKRIKDCISILEKKATYTGRVSDDRLLTQHIEEESINLVYSLFRNDVSSNDMKEYIKRIKKITFNNPTKKKYDVNVPLYRKLIYYFFMVIYS